MSEGRRKEAGGSRQEAADKRQEAADRRQIGIQICQYTFVIEFSVRDWIQLNLWQVINSSN